MRAPELLRELEKLSYSRRMARMVEVGRDPASAPALEELARGDVYERSLALQSAAGSRDGVRVLRGLADPSRGVRSLATYLLPSVCSDEEVLSALGEAPPWQRKTLLRRLRRMRPEVVDRFLTVLAVESAAGEHLPVLLAYGSAEVVRAHLDGVLERMWLPEWRRLARLHPALAAGALARRAEAERDASLPAVAQAVLPLLADTEPDLALEAVRALLRRLPVGMLDLERLARRRPAELAEFLLGSQDSSHVSLAHSAHRLEDSRLADLLRRRIGGLSGDLAWLERLPRERRRAMHAEAALAWRDREGVLDAPLVALLTGDLRETEARRHLAIPSLAARPEQRLPYASFLPWEEARAVLDPAVRNPDPELRSIALNALICAGRYHRERLDDVLKLVRDRRHEQDPVRLSMLAALAGLPPGRWRNEHLEGLGGVIQDALDAADLSPSTGQQAEAIILALLPFYPAWAAEWLTTLLRHRGHVSFYNLEARLSDAQVEEIAPSLLPVLRAWETREREGALVAFAQSLGKRLRVFPGLVDVLERLLADTRAPWIAASCVVLIRRHCPGRAARLIPELLHRDPSWITQPPVHEYLHERRQDLLTPFLGRKAYRGRFSTGRTRFVLPFRSGFHRWTGAQQATFAHTLEEVINDRDRHAYGTLCAIGQLAALTCAPLETLRRLARDTRPHVQEAALRALGRLDAGQGVPLLVEAVGDERARVAVYALRRALLEMPAARACALLREIPVEKVTAAKEVARLLGDLEGEEAYRELLRLGDRELHRDVRVALLRALWRHLERPETWPVLWAAVRSGDPTLAAVCARIPAERLSAGAQERLAELLAELLADPDAKVRHDLLARLAGLPLMDRQAVLLPPLLAALGSAIPDEAASAANAVLGLYAASDAGRIGRAVSSLLPNRRAVRQIVQALTGRVVQQRGHLQAAARAVLEALAPDPLTAAKRASLAVHALPWAEVGPFLAALAASGELHAEALMTAAHGLAGAYWTHDPEGLSTLERTLAGSEDERLRRLGVAALTAVAIHRGWNAECRARLEAYGGDPSPLVAAAAHFTFPPLEGEDSVLESAAPLPKPAPFLLPGHTA